MHIQVFIPLFGLFNIYDLDRSLNFLYEEVNGVVY